VEALWRRVFDDLGVVLFEKISPGVGNSREHILMVSVKFACKNLKKQRTKGFLAWLKLFFFVFLCCIFGLG